MREEELENIDQYLRNELSQEDKSVFQDRMSKDPVLAGEVEFRRQVSDAILDKQTQDLFHDLQQVQKDWDEKQSSHRLFLIGKKYAKLTIAATITLLLISSVLLYFLTQNSIKSNQEVFALYYVPPKSEPVRSEQSALEMKFSQASGLFEHQEYVLAQQLLEEIISNRPDYIKAIFYLGHCYLMTNDTEKSIQLFQKIIDHGDNIFVYEARWYQSLAYVKAGQIESAKESLMQVNETHDTKQLLKDLDNL